MRRNGGMMAIFLCAVLLLSMQAQCRPQLLGNSTELYQKKNGDFVLCMEFKCNYFSPNGDCFCCTGTSRKEYCFLTYSDCRAGCALCKPPMC
ncbi:unnamed protein product [Urochloa decumbens]|uniref:Uncharacterized protein n=1 Tax=Urochloa decumbens TaxID=240449 RepID=A0ABC8ZSU3_9POAL